MATDRTTLPTGTGSARIEDAGAPLQIRWRGDSYLDFGLE